MATSRHAAFASSLILREVNDMLVIGSAAQFGPLSLYQSAGIEGEVRRRLWRRMGDASTMQAIRRWAHETGVEPRLGMSISDHDLVEHIVTAIGRRQLTARVLSTETFNLPDGGAAVAPQSRPVAAPQTRSFLPATPVPGALLRPAGRPVLEVTPLIPGRVGGAAVPGAGSLSKPGFETKLREKLGDQLFQLLMDSTGLSADFLGKPVATMTTPEKLSILLLLTVAELTGEDEGDIADDFVQLLITAGITRIIGILVAWAASHAVGIGEIIDLALLGLLAWGAYSNARAICDGAEQFYEAIKTAINARTEPELYRAGMLMASAVKLLGISVIAAIMGKGAGKKGGGGKPKPKDTPAQLPPPRQEAKPPPKPPVAPEKPPGESAKPPPQNTTPPPTPKPADIAARADLRKQLEIKNKKAIERGEPEPYPDVNAEVESRMAGWKQVSERGFPNGFKDKEAFEAFKQKIKGELEKVGAPADEIGVHGSAVSKANPGDIDVGIRVDRATFDKLVEQASQGRGPNTMKTINNNAANGIMKSYYLPRVDGKTFPQAIYGAAGDMKVQVSFILKDGPFDIGPYLKF